MKKDVILAIGIGFLIGGITAILAISIPTFIKNRKLGSDKTTSNISPTNVEISTPKQVSWEVSQPEDNSLILEDQTKITGKISSGFYIVLDTDLDTKVVYPSVDNTFSIDVKLHQGTNLLYLSIYDQTGIKDSKTMTLYYTDEKI